jgi:hypothetical protein
MAESAARAPSDAVPAGGGDPSPQQRQQLAAEAASQLHSAAFDAIDRLPKQHPAMRVEFVVSETAMLTEHIVQAQLSGSEAIIEAASTFGAAAAKLLSRTIVTTKSQEHAIMTAARCLDSCVVLCKAAPVADAHRRQLICAKLHGMAAAATDTAAPFRV